MVQPLGKRFRLASPRSTLTFTRDAGSAWLAYGVCFALVAIIIEYSGFMPSGYPPDTAWTNPLWYRVRALHMTSLHCARRAGPKSARALAQAKAAELTPMRRRARSGARLGARAGGAFLGSAEALRRGPR